MKRSVNKMLKQTGFIASYVLYGISLLAIVGVAYGRLSNVNLQGKVVQDTVDEVAQQYEVLKTKIILCAAVYPDGDHGQFEARYPYPAPATADNQAPVELAICPAAPVGANTLAAMADGTPLPTSPPEFQGWVYQHTLTEGIRLRLEPRSANGAAAVRERLLRQFPDVAVAEGDQIVFQVLN